MLIWLYSITQEMRKPYDAPVAQLDRAFDYESRGWGFESSRVRQSICYSFYKILQKQNLRLSISILEMLVYHGKDSIKTSSLQMGSSIPTFIHFLQALVNYRIKKSEIKEFMLTYCKPII